MIKKIATLISTSIGLCFAQVSDFENLSINISSNSYWATNDVAVKGNLNFGNQVLANKFNPGYGGYWSGWALSNLTNTTLAGLSNQYSCSAGGDYSNTTSDGIFAIAGGSNPKIKFNSTQTSIAGFYITNTTYAYLSMRDGDSYAKKFGGTSGNDADYFRIKFEKYLNGELITNSGVDFYLADFRDANNSNDYILNTWQFVDLSSLGSLDSLSVTFESSDTGLYGINTPLYFCMDIDEDLSGAIQIPSNGFQNRTSGTIINSFTSGNANFNNTYTIDPNYGDNWESGFAFSKVNNTTLAGYENLYAASTGKGFNNSEVYAVGKQNAVIQLNNSNTVSGMYVSNTTYAYLSMRDGDSFGKKFGGNSGNDPDYFKLTAYGYNGGVLNTTNGVDFYLADFTSSTNSNDYILNTWSWMSLTALGVVDSIKFELSSSDVGSFGINTPLYFAFDNFSISNPTDLEFNNALENSNLTLYPNPANDEINIYSDEFISKIEIFTLEGIKVKKSEFENKIDISNLRSGFYIAEINETKRIKFMKK